jgi:hypothetical protein
MPFQKQVNVQPDPGKQRKTARELADMIAERMKIARASVAVNPHPVYGWHPTVEPGNDQQLAEQAAAELRGQYELKT